MVSSKDHSVPEIIGGVEPANFNVLTENELASIESYLNKTEEMLSEFIALENFFLGVESSDKALYGYALEKYKLTDVISSEDVNKAAIQAWERVKINLRRFQSDLFGFAKVINAGSERLVERLEMLKGLAEKANKEPFKDEISVRKNKKFAINGKFEPHDIRPLLDDTNNAIDFYNKVLVPYLNEVNGLLDNVEMDQTWTENTEMKFDLFTASKWMKNFTVVEEPDERFRAAAYLVRGVTAQGDKALYYAGPPNTKTENIKDWTYFINTVKTIRFRYIGVPGLQPVNESDNKIDVSNPTIIRQRINYLLGIAKRIQGQVGYDKKISTLLRNLERSAEKVRNSTRTLRTQVNARQGEEERIDGKPSVSDIVKDLVAILNAVTRTVNDYNNVLAGQLRLAGALGFIADLELKAFEAPIEKPDAETAQRLDT